jgi:hypothetical protein
VDGSGSMDAFIERQHAHRTFERLLQQLVGCFVSFSVFSDDASTLVEPTRVDADNAATIGETLHATIRASGTTALHRGLRHLRKRLIPAMTRLLHDASAADEEQWVVILTDGVADDTNGAAHELRRLEATCVPFVMGVGENYHFDYCDRIVQRDTTKYTHVADESTLVSHLSARPRLRRFTLQATADESCLYYNGNVQPHTNGRHVFVLKWHGEDRTEPIRLVLTNVDASTLTCQRARVHIQPDAQLTFAIRSMMHVTIALAHVKDLCFNVAAADMYGKLHELLFAKKTIRSYRVGMGASYDALIHMIETQVSEFTRMMADRTMDDDTIGRCNSSNIAAHLATSTARRAYTAPC